jgi:DNA repair ATPase RecN
MMTLRRMRAQLLTFVVCSCAVACREKPIDPMAKERRGPLVTAEQPPLPEDPVAGKRSELQWKKHLQAEEVERQMAFDRNRLKEHHGLIERIKAARETLDRSKTPSAVQQTLAKLEATLQQLQRDIDAIDRYKNSSRILPDYDALMNALKNSYPAAKLAAMGGNTDALSQARNDFDAHLRTMHAWLERLEKDDDEALEEAGE